MWVIADPLFLPWAQCFPLSLSLDMPHAIFMTGGRHAAGEGKGRGVLEGRGKRQTDGFSRGQMHIRRKNSDRRPKCRKSHRSFSQWEERERLSSSFSLPRPFPVTAHRMEMMGQIAVQNRSKNVCEVILMGNGWWMVESAVWLAPFPSLSDRPRDRQTYPRLIADVMN